MAKMIELPTQQEIKHLYWYEPESGIFRHRHNSCRAKAWSIAGHKETKGYVQIQIKKHLYMAHRLAWVYMTGNKPKDQIDHIDGQRNNNSWKNLREATNKENCENRKLNIRNKTGVRGVYMQFNKYKAEICHNYKRISIGTFATLEEAADAVKQKRIELFTHSKD